MTFRSDTAGAIVGGACGGTRCLQVRLMVHCHEIPPGTKLRLDDEVVTVRETKPGVILLEAPIKHPHDDRTLIYFAEGN